MAKINKKLGYNKNANVADVSLFVGLASTQDKNRTWKYRYFALKPVCRRHGGERMQIFYTGGITVR